MTSFGVLGSLEAFQGSHVVPLKGPRHRTVLARLLIARGRVVPVGALADDVWSGAPPPKPLVIIINRPCAEERIFGVVDVSTNSDPDMLKKSNAMP